MLQSMILFIISVYSFVSIPTLALAMLSSKISSKQLLIFFFVYRQEIKKEPEYHFIVCKKLYMFTLIFALLSCYLER